jgi:hypothetical protein
MFATKEEPPRVVLAFRLPKEENPERFEECLRAAGLVGGEFEVLPKEASVIFEMCMKQLGGSV